MSFFITSLIAGLTFAQLTWASVEDIPDWGEDSGGLPLATYLTINETDATPSPVTVQMAPHHAALQMMKTAFRPEMARRSLNLLNWLQHESHEVELPERYQRKNHFGSWIKDPSRQTCLNIRGLALYRDAQGSIQYKENRKCIIESGNWKDPYTGLHLSEAKDIQIDHMVPLKNAYISGAWKWTNARRCHYANYVGNNFHLLSVYGRENMRKADRTPAGYIPPDNEYVCKYLENWLKIKAMWNLRLDIDEAQAILNYVNIYNCKAESFTWSMAELEAERAKANNLPQTCQRR